MTFEIHCGLQNSEGKTNSPLSIKADETFYEFFGHFRTQHKNEKLRVELTQFI